MKFLNLLHARQVRAGAVLFTVLGMVFTTQLESFQLLGRTPRSTIGLSILAAWLGGRLFHLETSGYLGQYVRGLPISAAQRFGSKLLVAGFTIAASALVQAAYWYSSWPRAYAGWQPEHLYLPPTLKDLPLEVSWILLVFSVTAWLSNSFECRLASIQSGFVGWLLTLSLLAPVVWLAQWLQLDVDVAMSLTSLPLAAFFLSAAYRAYQLKGVGSARPKEQILKSPRGTDFAFWIPANVLLFAVPIGTLYPMTWFDDLDDFVPGGALALALSVGLLVGVIMLPWSIRQARARGLNKPCTVGLILLSLTGWGLLVWWGARRRGPMAHCANCDRRMLAALTECPKCHTAKIANVEKQLQWGQAPVALMLSPTAVSLTLALLPVNLRYVTTWKAQLNKDSPFDSVLLVNERNDEEALYGIRLGASLGAPWQGMATGHGSAYFERARPELSLRELVSALADDERQNQGQNDDHPNYVPAASELAEYALPPTVKFSVRARADDRPLELRIVQARTHADPQKLQIEFEFSVLDRSTDAGVARILDRLQGNTPLSEGELREFLNLGDPFLVALLEHVPARWAMETAGIRMPSGTGTGATYKLADDATLELRARFLEALEQLVRVRFGIGEGASVDSLLSDLDQHYEQIHDVDPMGNPPALNSQSGSLERHLDLAYPWILATSILASEAPTDLAGPIRASSIPACLAAGLSAKAELFEVCCEAFRRAERDSSIRIAAGWAMLAIDSARGTEALLASLEEQAEATCIDLLAFSDCGTKAFAFLDRQGARDDYDLAADLGHQTRFELRSYKGHLRAARGALESHLQPEDFLDMLKLYRFYAR